MRNSGALVLLLVIVANVFGWSLLNQYEDPKPWGQAISGVSFSPYQASEDPQADRHPTPAEIDGDLALLQGKVRAVRTYSATDGIEVTAELARKYGLQVTAGTYLDTRYDRNEKEIDGVIKMANENKNVIRVLVGNETLLRADITVDELINYIRRVRTQVKVPVSTAEPWHVWLTHPELGREVDFIAIHLLPYWEGLPLDKAIGKGVTTV